MYKSNITAVANRSIVHSFSDEDVRSLQKRFRDKKWMVSEVECRRLLAQADDGIALRIGNHHAILRKCSNNTYRILEKAFRGSGMMGRLADGGVEYDITDITGDYSYESIENSIQRGVVLSKADLANIPERKSLNAVMGGSASVLTGLANMEYRPFDSSDTYFLTKSPHAFRILSFDDAVDDLTLICRNNGGNY